MIIIIILQTLCRPDHVLQFVLREGQPSHFLFLRGSAGAASGFRPHPPLIEITIFVEP
jgi:hypothetical protein